MVFLVFLDLALKQVLHKCVGFAHSVQLKLASDTPRQTAGRLGNKSERRDSIVAYRQVHDRYRDLI